MVMRFNRAYCDELEKPVSPYMARELYTDEESEHFGQRLTFRCEDPVCRARVTAVGIYMSRKSKRALHFRTQEEHLSECSFLVGNASRGERHGIASQEDDFKISQFPSELDLAPRPRASARVKLAEDSEATNSSAPSSSVNFDDDITRRRTVTRTRYLDYVVDCFLSGEEESKGKNFTIAGKTKEFRRFFKRARYFQDEAGLIYYGVIDKLIVYKNKGVGLRFIDYIWSGERKQRIWVYISQEQIDGSSRRRAFLAETEELESAMQANESVEAYFVGAYPELETIERDGNTFELYKAELSSLDHLSLRFAKVR